jgi:hypothetical protein
MNPHAGPVLVPPPCGLGIAAIVGWLDHRLI